MFLSNILDSIIITNEGEGDGSGFVGPESWCEVYKLISVILQVLLRSVMCNYSSLWKTIHSLSNIDIEFAIVCNFSEIIFTDNFLRYDINGKLHIFVTIHWCVEIKT